MLKFWLVVTAATITLSATQQTAGAQSQLAVEKLPDNATIEKLATSPVSESYLADMLSAASSLNDYQCFCQMEVVKNNQWKDFGGANLYFKQKEKLRAEIVSSDYRNGSVVVKDSNGKIRGKGGGGLGLIKMTLQPDSRSIRLPTGFSLVNCDFMSLYDTLKRLIGNGIEASSSDPTSLAAFKQPVQVLCFKKKDEGFVHVIYLNPKTKIPVAWNTYINGEAHAAVFFDKLAVNKGLSDNLFHL